MSDNDVTEPYPVPDLSGLPADVLARIRAEGEASGFVPNVFLTLARRPAEFRAFFAYYDALMGKEGGGLTRADREMIVTATSAANDCLYCVVAHGALLRLFERDPHIADRVAVNWRSAGLPARQHAMLEFALKVCERPGEVGDADRAALYEHGFDDEDAWDIAAITGFFGLSNRVATVAKMAPNPQFYLLGRVPKDVYAQLTAQSPVQDPPAAG